MTDNSNIQNGRNQFRIIGGHWRSRHLSFPPGVEGLRPTPDRIRETLFNWLQQKTPGASCLDLFAGSAALAFEACSRGAATVTAIDKHPQVTESISANARLLDCDSLTTITLDSLTWLRNMAGKYQFDIVFLDPPYSLKLLPQCLQLLETGDFLAPGAIIYLEADVRLELLPLASSWRLLKSKKAGHVFYGICERPAF